MSPAERAAAAAQARVEACLGAGRSFRLEAGAGAGKTYSLVLALKKLMADRGRELQRRGQRVACITFTEVARDEIVREIEQHPAILVETIHAFSWAFMARFQKELRALVSALVDRRDRIEEAGGVGGQAVEYQLGFFGIDEERITLSHDDVPHFMAQLLNNPKFRMLLTATFPVIFIDEYQDTNPHFMKALSTHFLATGEGPQIGLYGDHWQTIYRDDHSLIAYPGLEPIDKGSNFRSAPVVVDVLNSLRPELVQEVSDPGAFGEARFFHANAYVGERTDTRSSKGDTPPEASKAFLDALLGRLRDEGWDLAPERTKVLMLTHNAIAAEQGYSTIAKSFDNNDAFVKKEDPLIAFLADTVEPMCAAYVQGRHGDMFRILGAHPELRSYEDKLGWSRDMASLVELRSHGTIGDVVDLLVKTRRPRLPDRVSRRERELATLDGEPSRSLRQHREVRAAPYREFARLAEFIGGRTPFATQHSVKGAQFDNVVVVLGGGWNHYNWPRMLELLTTKALTPKNQAGFHRARNLFYVAISRPKVRLAVLATQTMSADALASATRLFGAGNVVGLTP